MRKLTIFLSLLLILSCLGSYPKAQCPGECLGGTTVNSKKISYKGKAPFPWAIDGQIGEWGTILGQNTENSPTPFELPDSSVFNWATDLDSNDENCILKFDTPSPKQDITLSAFTHDDYNVFFYFRRLDNGNSPNSFYYFCDVNADGYMAKGEPVFHASFTQNYIASLTLSRYIPDATAIRIDGADTTHLYIRGKGNPLAIGSDSGDVGGVTYFTVQNYAMPGRLEKVFNSDNIPFKKRLRKNEIFAAAITEYGYGVELAIPWRYLRMWLLDKRTERALELSDQDEGNLDDPSINSAADINKDKHPHIPGNRWKNTKPLHAGDIFFYKLSMKEGRGRYRPASVVDNVGSSCHGVGKSGDVALNSSISTPGLIPDSGYRFKIAYTNLTNATEVFSIQSITLTNIERNDDSTSDTEKAKVTVYLDENCNGIIDSRESNVDFILDDSSNDTYNFRQGIYYPAVTPKFRTGCFIADILLPGNIVSSDVTINPIIWFISPDYCEVVNCSTGRVIKQIGSKSGKIVLPTLVKNKLKENEVSRYTRSSGVVVYPNPANSTTMIYLPKGKGAVDISLVDYLGIKQQQWHHVNSSFLQISNLNRGFYFLKVRYVKSGKVETQKILVQ